MTVPPGDTFASKVSNAGSLVSASPSSQVQLSEAMLSRCTILSTRASIYLLSSRIKTNSDNLHIAGSAVWGSLYLRTGKHISENCRSFASIPGNKGYSGHISVRKTGPRAQRSDWNGREQVTLKSDLPAALKLNFYKGKPEVYILHMVTLQARGCPFKNMQNHRV